MSPLPGPLLGALLGATLGALSPAAAVAQPAEGGEVPERPVRIEAVGKRVLLSFDVSDLIDHAARDRLTSGMSVPVVLRAYLFSENGGAAVQASVRVTEVRHDLWVEDFELREGGEQAGSPTRVPNMAALIAALGRVDAFDGFDLGRIEPGQRYYVAISLEVDALTAEQLSEVRRWLSRPRAGHRGLDLGGRSFFGSFVSLFVNVRVGDAVTTARFRGPSFGLEDLVQATAGP
jgi:hypothetical protein